jgi:hypothetical protein
MCVDQAVGGLVGFCRVLPQGYTTSVTGTRFKHGTPEQSSIHRHTKMHFMFIRTHHNKELNDLCSSPNIVRVIKSRGMR